MPFLVEPVRIRAVRDARLMLRQTQPAGRWATPRRRVIFLAACALAVACGAQPSSMATWTTTQAVEVGSPLPGAVGLIRAIVWPSNHSLVYEQLTSAGRPGDELLNANVRPAETARRLSAVGPPSCFDFEVDYLTPGPDAGSWLGLTTCAVHGLPPFPQSIDEYSGAGQWVRVFGNVTDNPVSSMSYNMITREILVTEGYDQCGGLASLKGGQFVPLHLTFVADGRSWDAATSARNADSLTSCGDGSQASDGSWSSSGTRLAFFGRAGGDVSGCLFTSVAGTGTASAAWCGLQGVSMPLWQPGGALLALSCEVCGGETPGIWLVNPQKQTRQRISQRLAGPIGWSPDGQRLAAGVAMNSNPATTRQILVWAVPAALAS